LVLVVLETQLRAQHHQDKIQFFQLLRQSVVVVAVALVSQVYWEVLVAEEAVRVVLRRGLGQQGRDMVASQLQLALVVAVAVLALLRPT
jgi:hypothetical protein